MPILKQTSEWAKAQYEKFRLYHLASYALNHSVSSRNFNCFKEIEYGTLERQKFDLYQSRVGDSSSPVVIFVHGGAWKHGDKKDYRFIGESLAKEGFHVVVLNYRLAPENIFPVSVDDLNLCLNHLEQALGDYDIHTQRWVLMGHSAGAFNIMSSFYHANAESKTKNPKIKALIGLAGPYHFDYKDDPICADAFDQSCPYQRVMPYYFVYPNAVQHYLFTAEKDDIVGKSNSIDFAAALKNVGNHCETKEIAGLGHVSMIGAVASLFARFYDMKAEILTVLKQV